MPENKKILKIHNINDKAIISTNEYKHYLTDYNCNLSHNVNPEFNKDFYFSSYEILKDNKIKFYIDVLLNDEYSYISGFINSDGKVSNYFYVDKYELYLNDSYINKTEDILKECFKLVYLCYDDNDFSYTKEYKKI